MAPSGGQGASAPGGPQAVPPLLGGTLGGGDGAFVVVERTDAGGPPDPPHVHWYDDEAWYVLAGVLRFRLGEQELEATAGAGVWGPRGVPHTFWNPGPGPARYLIVMTPNTHRLVQAYYALTDRSPAAVQALSRRYGVEQLP
jgi:mannose-6-phosphate isomerase-like protein (cupin superfamily)